MPSILEKSKHRASFVALLLIVGAMSLCLSHSALAEGNCPPGQTDKLENYAGRCVDPKLIDPETGRLRKASKCPPGQTDKLENYAGRCVDPKLIDPETGRLRKASKCAPGESDTTKHYKGTCVRLDQLDETGRLRKQIGKEKSPQEETAPQRPMKIIKKKPQAEENPCGKGWYKAADGQCYPRLN
jgi:hypothetical protein